LSVAVRMALSLCILKKPFWGMVLALLGDNIDIHIMRLGSGYMGFEFRWDWYQYIDKCLDIFMSLIALRVGLGFEDPLARKVTLGLFIFRAIGVGLFLVFGLRWILFVFPDLFEFFFLIYTGMLRFFPHIHPTRQQFIFGLSFLLAPKLYHEYGLHILPIPPWTPLFNTIKSYFLRIYTYFL